MKTYFYLWVLFFVAVNVRNISAQSEIRIKEWGKPHGIESTIIFGVIQDKNQLMWICTYNGLYYFDGFRAYKANILEADGKTPIEGIVNQILQTPDGKYWLEVENRLGRYDVYSKKFEPLKIPVYYPSSIFLANGNELFISNPQKTFLVNRESLELTPMVLLDEQGNTLNEWVRPLGSSGKYYSFLEGFPVEVIPSGLPGQFIQQNNADTAGIYWNKQGFFPINKDVHGNTWYKHPHDFQWMVFDSLGTDISSDLLPYFEKLNVNQLYSQLEYSLFITDKGLVIWEKGAGQPRYLFEEFPNILTGGLFINFDAGKSLWHWTRKGVSHIRVNPSNFSSISDGLHSNFILGIYPVNEDKYLIRHDFLDTYFSIFEPNSQKAYTIPEDTLISWVGSSPYLNHDKNGDPVAWIKRHGERIHQLSSSSPNRNPFSSIFFISGGQSYDYVLYPGDIDSLATQLRRISDNTLIFPRIDPLQYANQGDTVWIGTESQGLVALHTPTGKTAQWLPDPTNPSAIPANRVHAVIPMSDGNLWLGTRRGLAYFDKKEERFTTYRTSDGLIDDRIYCMAFDRNGFLWIGTGNGMSRFDPQTKAFVNFTKEDGLVNSEYNRNSAILLEDGTMLMGGMEGIDYFNPDEIEENLEKPQPLIAHIHNNDKLINRNIQVAFGQEENHFSFYISANPIWMASTLTYQYRLEGAETDWQSLNFTNTVHYPNLPPGNYRFEVKIANQPEIASYPFTIHPVWYRTWWFKVSYILSGLFVGYLFYRTMLAKKLYHLEQEKRIMAIKAEQALSITKERERLIADLHDDVGATLSSLHIYGELAGNVWESQPEKAKDMVGKIKEQSKDLMDRMSDIVWSMKDLSRESDLLRSRVSLYANDFLTSKGIFFSANITPEVEKRILEPELRRSLLLIIKEALNNIAKHSEATDVSLQLYQKREYLMLKIKDNGRGMDVSAAQKGNGLGNIHHRCAKMNGKLTIKSQPGLGTTLTCRIPLATISLAPDSKSI